MDDAELHRLRDENARLQKELADLKQRLGPYPPGHFHSPIPDLDEVRRDEAQVFGPEDRPLPGLERHDAAQWDLLAELVLRHGDVDFARHPSEGRRYYWDNQVFQYADAFALQAMLRKLWPRRWVEIGSGFSSAVLLDTLDRHPELPTRAVFVDPDPTRVNALLSDADRRRCEYRQQRVQEVPLSYFETLEQGDVLFVDSSHVSKLGSDVNWLFFEVVPRLRSGVYLHVHDIPPDFEYSRAWAYAGWAWNEAYLLRAFLMFNSAFRIVLHPAYLAARDPVSCQRMLPDCPGVGTSLWLVRT